MTYNEYSELLREHGLKVTPQRVAVLEALDGLRNHPTADQIIEYIRANHPNVAIGTVYRTLETFAGRGLISRVQTEADVMRYDGVRGKHHHLYCADTERIEDYTDEALTSLIEEHFRRRKIKNFIIDDIRLQLVGRFTDSKR